MPPRPLASILGPPLSETPLSIFMEDPHELARGGLKD